MTRYIRYRGSGVRDSAQFSFLRRVLVTLGGGRTDILAHAEVDATEMTGRGIAAVIPAIFGSLAMTASASYAFSLRPAAAALVGVAWGLIVLAFDLSLMTAASDRAPVLLAVTLGCRAIVAVLAALAFAGSLVMFFYAKDVGVQVRADQQAGLAAYNRRFIEARFGPPVRADWSVITASRREEAAAGRAVAAATQRVARDKVQVTCEAGGVSLQAGCQRGSGRVGRGPVYQVRLNELRNAEAGQAAARAHASAVAAQAVPQVRVARADIKVQRAQEHAAYANARARYLADDGLLARWHALSQLEAADPQTRAEAYLLEALIVAIDMSAVLTKVSSRTPSYDRVMKAMRKTVSLQAATSEDEAASGAETRRAELDALADIRDVELEARVEVATMWIRAWTAVEQQRAERWSGEQMAGPESAAADGARWQDAQKHTWPPAYERSQPRASRGRRVPTLSLSEFSEASRSHERAHVPMAASLRKLAFIGCGLLAALAGGLGVARAAHLAVSGTWLVACAATGAAALAAYSRGFRRGPGWTHRAAFGTAVICLILPLVIVALNI